MKTPGVYIVEKNAFPNSVVEVATAIPAFIGYTACARKGDASLTNKPWRISSLPEYVRCFGGPNQPVFELDQVPAAAVSPPPPTAVRVQEAEFALDGKTYRLTRAALKAGGGFLMHQAMTHFFANGGGACYVVSVGEYSQEIKAGDEHTGLIGGLAPLAQEQEPTLVLAPDAVLLSEPDCIRVQQQLLAHCGTLRNRFAILDVWGGDRAPDDAESGWNCITEFRNHIGSQHLSDGATYYPWLHTALVPASALDFNIFGAGLPQLARLLQAELALAADPQPKAHSNAIQSLLNSDDAWRAQGPDAKASVHQRLLSTSRLYAEVMRQAAELINLMPPSAAMAGLYTLVDSTRGVWKAPANVSVALAIRPAVALSHEDQEDINVTPLGKSINAIRSFVGKGVLVWGARTLDGNSLDWRYINVRRTVIMLEESCKLAVEAMVFEPNVRPTWVTIKLMIDNFLTSIWRRGGLAGC